jgi:hypothetical protein
MTGALLWFVSAAFASAATVPFHSRFPIAKNLQ